MTTPMRLGAGLWLLLASACSTEDPAAPADAGAQGARDGGELTDSGSGSDDAGAGPDVKVGAFDVQLVAPNTATNTPGYSSLFGKIYDGPSFDTVIWEEQASEDGCTLLVPRVPFCDPGCGSQACVEDDVCQAYPIARSAGTLQVEGLRQAGGSNAAFTVEPIQASYTTPASVDLAYPPLAEGETVTVKAQGDAVKAFEITGRGIAPLVLATEGAFPIISGQPLAITWQAPSTGLESRIRMRLDISHHGGSKGKIECEVDDDGAFDIPSALVDQLVALGVAGFPTVIVTRSSTSSVLTNLGRVELQIYASVERAVSIPGLVSCTTKDDCEAGQTCRSDRTCQ